MGVHLQKEGRELRVVFRVLHVGEAQRDDLERRVPAHQFDGRLPGPASSSDTTHWSRSQPRSSSDADPAHGSWLLATRTSSRNWLALVEARNGLALVGAPLAIYFLAYVSKSGIRWAARASRRGASGETTRWHRSACVPRVSVLLRRSWRLGGRREVAHQVGSDVAGLVATRGELADRPELPATAAQGSSDPCCTTCARRTTRGVVSRKGAPRTVFDPRVKCLVRAVNRWWGGWGSNPRPRDYEWIRTHSD